MKAIPAFIAALALFPACPHCPGAGAQAYPPGPDSQPQPGVPRGDLIRFEWANSKVFPGTTRQVTIYVPREYDPNTPACLLVDQDGVQWNAPVVLDNLIAGKEVPVEVGVFVTPGIVPPRDPKLGLSRYNRSFEYDGLGDAYARLILGEILPEVERRTAPDGRPIRLSHSANDRAIAGSSSGAIAAFTVAWEHPEAFSRVVSAIGTYVGLRGGERYPTLVRKYEPRPIRVFLQDGSHDLNIYGGDWWMANQTLERALEFGGYEVSHVWGEGGHSGEQMASVLPDALRWIWKDWPKPVGRGVSQNGALAALLVPGEDWKVAATTRLGAGEPYSDLKGNVYFDETPAGTTYRIAPDGSVSDVGAQVKNTVARRFGTDGRLYAAEGPRIVAHASDSTTAVLAAGFIGRDIAVAHDGYLYVTEPGLPGGVSHVWLVRPGGRKQIVDTGLLGPTGVALSPDQSLLYVAESRTQWIYSYQIEADGAVRYKQRYFWLHTSDTGEGSNAGGMCCDQAGWLYVGTDLGIQVCDQAGRVEAILPLPEGRVTGVCFGGAHFDTLFASSGSSVYRRRIHALASNPWENPVLPAPPKL
jgi:sugar lactone lactonase YvrE/enterochelin esterase-like enzyme